MRKPSATNAVLLVIIGVLALTLLVRVDPGAGVAQAQTTEPPFNATEQRKQMIAALTQMNSRLATIETKLSTTLSVKVTELPPVVIKDDERKNSK